MNWLLYINYAQERGIYQKTHKLSTLQECLRVIAIEYADANNVMSYEIIREDALEILKGDKE